MWGIGWGSREVQEGKDMCIHIADSLHHSADQAQHCTAIQFSSVQSLSRVQLFVTPWIAARQASLSITDSRSPLKLMSTESVVPSSHLILCCPLLLLPPIPPSIRVFSNEPNLLMRWPTYWSFSFSSSLSNEHPGLISFRMDWLDLLAVQGTLKSLLQYHSNYTLIKTSPACWVCVILWLHYLNFALSMMWYNMWDD